MASKAILGTCFEAGVVGKDNISERFSSRDILGQINFESSGLHQAFTLDRSRRAGDSKFLVETDYLEFSELGIKHGRSGEAGA